MALLAPCASILAQSAHMPEEVKTIGGLLASLNTISDVVSAPSTFRRLQ